jgi:hypothetical protein
MKTLKFWLVWNEQGRNPTYKHATEADARAEAERLAKTYGGTFHVMALVASCQKNDVTWREAELPKARREWINVDPAGPEYHPHDGDPFADE